MHEIVTPEQAQTLVRGAAAGLLAIGIIGGAAAGALVRRRRVGPIVGGFVALAGALVYALWLAYNAVTARLGLDSVKALVINLAIFVVVGLGYGILAVVGCRWAKGGLEGSG